jgi:superfamily II DNA/RNA helicase
LAYEGVMVDTLYGETPGRERKEALQRFRAGRTELLIATDVAARGLDVPGLPLVIQFDPALDADHYVHRAGRTGRMGREGISITLMTPQEQFIAEKLSRQLGIQMEQKTLYEGRVVSPEAAAVRRKQRVAAGGETPDAAKAPSDRKRAQADVRSGVKLAGSTFAKSGSKSAPAASKGTKIKASRHRDRKNKGAPRWLKEKWETGPKP